MDTTPWRDAGTVQEVVAPWPVRVVGSTTVRLLRVDEDRVVAVAPACPHLGAPLSSAEVAGDRIECPRHWYAFDVDTGACVVPARDDLRLARWPTRVVDGRVLVRTP